MSNRCFKTVSRTGIPQVSGGTVPLTPLERYIFGPTKPADVLDSAGRFVQVDDKLSERFLNHLIVKASSVGSHATFTATIEGSEDGIFWIGLQLTYPPPTGITTNAIGVSFAAAIASSGLVLPVAGGFHFLRVGLAGDNAAADGAARFGFLALKDF